MPPNIVQELWELIPTVVYLVVGLLLFGFSLLVVDKMLPFSMRKEIEEDENIALAILMGCGIIGLALILAAVIR